MKIISHRGNLDGPNSCKENHPDSILAALNQGFDCEIDVWHEDGKLFLGHDGPEYEYDIAKWMLERNSGLWIHCKDYLTLLELSYHFPRPNQFQMFFHNKDDYTLTSNGIIWTYPGVYAAKNCVSVLEGLVDLEHVKLLRSRRVMGVCTDYPLDFQSKYLSSLDEGSLTTQVTASETA